MLESWHVVLRCCARLLLVGGAVTYSALAPALGLGDITLHSALNQPLRADIALVDVGGLDVFQVQAAVAQRVEHGTARTVHVGRGHVAGVGAHAVARHLGVDLRAAGFGVFVLFEHHHASAFTQDKSITVFVPRARCSSRIVVAGRQGTHGRKATNTQR